jgi:predicted  nucleic acid-binding Zn-ribbon protein
MKQVDIVGDHVSHLEGIVEEYRKKSLDTMTHSNSLSNQLNDYKIELEVARKRASNSESELLSLRKDKYSLEFELGDFKVRFEEMKQRMIEE